MAMITITNPFNRSSDSILVFAGDTIIGCCWFRCLLIRVPGTGFRETDRIYSRWYSFSKYSINNEPSVSKSLSVLITVFFVPCM